MLRAKSIVVPAALAAVVGSAYFFTLTQHVTEDSIKYVKEALTGGAALFHPHHLFYHGLMALLVHLSGTGIADVDRSVWIMQLGNVALSVVAVLVFYALCRRIGAGAVRAAVFALLFGLASGFFEFASQVEVYNGMALSSCVAVLGLVTPATQRRRGWLIGLGYFFTMGFHQVGIFLGVAILLHEWQQEGWVARRRAIALGLVAPLVAIAASYAIVGWLLGHQSPRGLWGWMTLYGHMPYWGLGRPDVATLRNLAVGLGKALVDVTHLPNVLLLLPLCGLGTFIALHLRGWPRSGSRRRLLVALAGWLVGYGLFMTWWDAANVESWIIACVPFMAMLAILAAERPESALSCWKSRVAWSGLVLCLGFMGVADAVYVRHDRQPNWAKEAAVLLRREAGAGDLVLAIDTDKGAYYELYLQGRGVTVEPINFQPAIDAAQQSTFDAFTDALVAELVQRADAVLKRDRRCFVDQWVEQGQVNPIRHMSRFDLPRYREGVERRFGFRPLVEGTMPLIYEVTEVR